MKLYETVKKTEEVVIGAICNKCGRDFSELENACQDYHEFEIIFGYTTKLDGERWNFDLCSDCIIAFSNTFEIPVQGEVLI